MKKVLFFMLLSVLSFHQTQAATKADVSKAVELMRTAKSSGKLLAYKEYGRQDGSFQCVYIVGSKRYTVYYTPDTDIGWLAFWMRPVGTNGTDSLRSFVDYDSDGHIEKGYSYETDEKMFNIRDDDIGRQHQKHWQSLYDKAITDTIKRLK